MIEGITLQLVIRIVAAVIVLWFASVHIREHKVMWPYVPLFIYFTALASTASAEFYGIFITDLQTIFDALFLVFYIWLLLVIVALLRKNQHNTNI